MDDPIKTVRRLRKALLAPNTWEELAEELEDAENGTKIASRAIAAEAANLASSRHRVRSSVLLQRLVEALPLSTLVELLEQRSDVLGALLRAAGPELVAEVVEGLGSSSTSPLAQLVAAAGAPRVAAFVEKNFKTHYLAGVLHAMGPSVASEFGKEAWVRAIVAALGPGRCLSVQEVLAREWQWAYLAGSAPAKRRKVVYDYTASGGEAGIGADRALLGEPAPAPASAHVGAAAASAGAAAPPPGALAAARGPAFRRGPSYTKGATGTPAATRTAQGPGVDTLLANRMSSGLGM